MFLHVFTIFSLYLQVLSSDTCARLTIDDILIHLDPDICLLGVDNVVISSNTPKHVPDNDVVPHQHKQNSKR